MDVVHRIYTEDTAREAVIETVGKQFDNFTLHGTTGYYKGKSEKSLVVEIIEGNEGTVEALARAIRAINGQKSVLIKSLSGRTKKIT
jgi:hypothetical protein